MYNESDFDATMLAICELLGQTICLWFLLNILAGSVMYFTTPHLEESIFISVLHQNAAAILTASSELLQFLSF